MPLGIDLTRSQLLYRTAQVLMLHIVLHMLLQTPELYSHVMAVMRSRCKRDTVCAFQSVPSSNHTGSFLRNLAACV